MTRIRESDADEDAMKEQVSGSPDCSWFIEGPLQGVQNGEMSMSLDSG